MALTPRGIAAALLAVLLAVLCGCGAESNSKPAPAAQYESLLNGVVVDHAVVLVEYIELLRPGAAAPLS